MEKMTTEEKQQKEISLNHAEFIVLGLIAEESSHAYNINKKIEERGMRNWTNIGRSSIYRVIKSLEKENLANKWIEEVDNRIQHVYKITDLGFQTLRKKVFTVLREFHGRNDEDFYVAYSMLPILTKEEQIEAITYSLNKIRIHKKELEEMLEKNSKYPINVTGLFIHPIKILQVDIEFLEWILEELKKGSYQIGPKAYNK